MKKDKLYLLRKLLLASTFFSLLLFVSSCEVSTDPIEEEPTPARGVIIKAESSGSITKEIIKASLQSENINIDVKYDVDYYKIVYYSQDSKGNLTIASGALFIPKGKDNLSLVSLHHGTQTNRTKVGSVNWINAPEGVLSASLGYFTVVPDYLGLGESQILHPYLHAKSSADAVIDFIRAGRSQAKKLNIKLNGEVFLAGYSEGGYVTLAAHREIQQNYNSEIKVTASSPMAGPYDLYLTSQTVLKNSFYNKPSYMVFLAAAYNNVYGWDNIASIFNHPYASMIPSLTDGSKSVTDIDSQLPHDPSQLFTPAFLTTFLNGTETVFSNALKENSLLNWAPNAPIRFYHGNKDQYVPYENSTAALNYFRSRGANVELITIEGGDHGTSLMPSVLSAIIWFESMKAQKTLAFN